MASNFAVKFVGVPEDQNGNPINPDHCGQVIKEEGDYYYIRLRKNKRIEIEKKEYCKYWSKDVMTIGDLKELIKNMNDDDFIFVEGKKYEHSVYDYNYYSNFMDDPYDEEKKRVGALFLKHIMSNYCS